jgi:hypothetical protein
MHRIIVTSTYLSDLLVLLPDQLELVLDLVLQLNEEGLANLADGGLGELFDCCALGLAVEFGELLFEDGGPLLEGLLEGSLESFVGLLLCPQALALADVAPGGLDVGHDTAVDGLYVGASQVVEHVST